MQYYHIPRGAPWMQLTAAVDTLWVEGQCHAIFKNKHCVTAKHEGVQRSYEVITDGMIAD